MSFKVTTVRLPVMLDIFLSVIFASVYYKINNIKVANQIAITVQAHKMVTALLAVLAITL